MTVQIEIDQVSFHYPGIEEPVLDNVSLTVDKGDFLAIIGSNGSGKSTLCKLINGLIPHYYVGDYSGKVTVNGLVTSEHKVTDFSSHVGYVYQDFENQLVSPRVLEDASFAPLNFGHIDYLERGKRALHLVGLTNHDNEFIWQLSGGQKHQLALAGALALDPDILIIDEPIAQLDPEHATQIYDILKKLNREYRKTIIVIEHHTEFIADYCNKVVLMDAGKVVWKKDTKEALTEVSELLQRQIYPPQVTLAAFQLGYPKEQLPITVEEAESVYGTVSLTEKEQNIEIENEFSMRERLIEIKDASFSHKLVDRSKKQIVKNINIDIYKNDLIALIGNNGAGKSTLMRLLTGLVKPEDGEIVVQGQNTRYCSPEKLADVVTYIYQNPEEMFIEDCVRRDVEFFLKARKVPGYEEQVDKVLKQFELTELQEKDSRLMSGGQQRRASLAIGVAMNPSIILLDEPTANLDMATRKYITKLINSLKEQVGAVLIATHDMQLVAEWANRIIVLHEGEVIHDGNRESVFQNYALLEKAGLKVPQILELSRRLKQKNLAYTVQDFVQSIERKERLLNGVH
ncbi:ABC transporter ATP-binding protein [Cytobacillus oceanisediminis]|uniref:ABC transporter ATP-binding protein n=1 Tax=Bacillaceae TaxID=186817 RepID=UPI0003329277|nr:energy-coupling factor transporter ATPase [Cytobacillus oceanisediminis]EOR27174.1 cobalt/nickel ABC transporter ATP-binding protein [Niallia nealsonii AAU1]MBQ6446407.1 ABC transporter ATP-binding protein [Bacillus sp. (in: firmicutes)]MBZ9537022.1 ABC transporter ATP-binding protein [Cytobacillus oceanisediminis]